MGFDFKIGNAHTENFYDKTNMSRLIISIKIDQSRFGQLNRKTFVTTSSSNWKVLHFHNYINNP